MITPLQKCQMHRLTIVTFSIDWVVRIWYILGVRLGLRAGTIAQLISDATTLDVQQHQHHR